MQGELRKELSEKSREQIENELLRAREVLKIMGSAYYAARLMSIELGTGRLPDQAPVAMDWLKEAHTICEGETLEDPDFRLSEGAGMLCYMGLFEDSQKNQYVFTHNYDDGSTTLRVGEDEPCHEVPPEPETHLWFQAVVQAAARRRGAQTGGQFGVGYNVWDIVRDCAKVYETAIKAESKLIPSKLELKDNFEGGVFEKAFQLTQALKDHVNQESRSEPAEDNSGHEITTE